MQSRQTVIIFEGPDGVGKTEIATALSQHLSIPYFRMGSQHNNWRKGKFKEALEFDQTYISEFLVQTNFDVIIDRAYPSERVYSDVFKRETNHSVLKDVDEKFASIGATIIILLRRDYTNSRDDDLVSSDKLVALHNSYVAFASWTKCNVMQVYVDDLQNDLKIQIPIISALLRSQTQGVKNHCIVPYKIPPTEYLPAIKRTT